MIKVEVKKEIETLLYDVELRQEMQIKQTEIITMMTEKLRNILRQGQSNAYKVVWSE